jgi:membrane-associated protein
MDFLSNPVDFILHVDKHLLTICETYQAWTYAILFVIVFCETGLVVTPFLPGDSLIFAAGVLAHKGQLNPFFIFALLSLAAVLGDTVNYWLGKYLGPRVLRNENSRIFKKQYLDKTHAYFEKYGGKTIIIARFVPIVRTFAPFVAGVGAMSYGPFLMYNVAGGVLWVAICNFAGYFFASVPFVEKHFSIVVLMIILISIMPAVIEYIRHRQEARRVGFPVLPVAARSDHVSEPALSAVEPDQPECQQP